MIVSERKMKMYTLPTQISISSRLPRASRPVVRGLSWRGRLLYEVSKYSTIDRQRQNEERQKETGGGVE